jgi:hypothetical protein
VSIGLWGVDVCVCVCVCDSTQGLEGKPGDTRQASSVANQSIHYIMREKIRECVSLVPKYLA